MKKDLRAAMGSDPMEAPAGLRFDHHIARKCSDANKVERRLLERTQQRIVASWKSR